MGGYVFKLEDGHGYVDMSNLFAANSGPCVERMMRAALLQRKDDVDELMDRSKTNPLSRTVAYGQMLWFCANFLGRFLEGLTITKLEVASLAYIAMTLATYYFWMNKPLDVDCPIVVTAGTHQSFGGVWNISYPQRPSFIRNPRRNSGACTLMSSFTACPEEWFSRQIFSNGHGTESPCVAEECVGERTCRHSLPFYHAPTL